MHKNTSHLIALVAAANIRDVRAGAQIQNLTTAAKLIALVAVALVGVAFTVRYAPAREDQQLLDRIEQGLRAITFEEHAQLLQRWAQQMLPASVGQVLAGMQARPPPWLLALAAALAATPLLPCHLRQRHACGRRERARAAGMISHEVRNAAQAVLASIDLLKQSRLAKGQRELVAAASAAGQSMCSLLNRTLDFSRLANGAFQPRARPCNPASLCQQALDAVRPQAQLKGLDLRFDTPPARRVLVDPDGLRQIIGNLLGNAVKFTDAGSVELRLRLAPATHPNELLIEVIDSGIGIAPSQVAGLFLPFSQDRNGRERGGAGLGLSIAHGLALAMGGSLGAHSVQGRGSRFTLRLPVRPAGRSQRPGPTARATRPLAGIELLLVEDHDLNRHVIAEQLRHLGASVHALADAASALAEQARRPRPVLLLDIGLRDMDGYALARRLRQQQDPAHPLRLLALSARSGGRHVARCHRAGFDAALTKPLQTARLLHALGLPMAEDPGMQADASPLATAYVADIARELRQASQAIEARDPAALRHHAHRLQGVLQMLGEGGQAEIAADLWALGHDAAPDWADARRLLQVLRARHGPCPAEAMPTA